MVWYHSAITAIIALMILMNLSLGAVCLCYGCTVLCCCIRVKLLECFGGFVGSVLQHYRFRILIGDVFIWHLNDHTINLK